MDPGNTVIGPFWGLSTLGFGKRSPNKRKPCAASGRWAVRKSGSTGPETLRALGYIRGKEGELLKGSTQTLFSR